MSKRQDKQQLNTKDKKIFRLANRKLRSGEKNWKSRAIESNSLFKLQFFLIITISNLLLNK